MRLRFYSHNLDAFNYLVLFMQYLEKIINIKILLSSNRSSSQYWVHCVAVPAFFCLFQSEKILKTCSGKHDWGKEISECVFSLVKFVWNQPWLVKVSSKLIQTTGQFFFTSSPKLLWSDCGLLYSGSYNSQKILNICETFEGQNHFQHFTLILCKFFLKNKYSKKLIFSGFLIQSTYTLIYNIQRW